MVYPVLITLTWISCWLFDISGIPEIVSKLMKSYKEQFQLISDTEMDDAAKQQRLLKMVGFQMKLLLKLVGGILLFLAPFFSLYLLQELHPSLHPGILASWEGIIVPLLAVVVYILIKRNYGRIFRNR